MFIQMGACLYEYDRRFKQPWALRCAALPSHCTAPPLHTWPCIVYLLLLFLLCFDCCSP